MIPLLNRIKFALCLLGVFLIIGGIYSYIKYNETPVKLETLKPGDVKAGKMVEGQVSFNFGVYEQKASTHYGFVDKSSQRIYFIIPIENKFMGISVKSNSKRFPIFSAQTQKTFEYYNNNGALPAPIRVNGSITAMNKKEIGFFQEAIQRSKLTEGNVNDVIVPYYIACDAFSGYLTMFIAGVVALGLGIAAVVVTKNA